MALIKTSVSDGVALVAIDHPPVNVLSKAVLLEIGAAIAGFRKDPAVRGVVLTGEGANFAAGADIREIAQISDAAQGEAMSLEAHKLVLEIEDGDLPVLAAINGICFGGGCELALACHLRIAADNARIAQPEIKIGIIPGMGGSIRLPRLVGGPKALEMLLTGEPVSAQEALRVGLVNLVVPEADLRRQATMLMAKRVGPMSKVAVAGIMRAVREGRHLPMADAVRLEAKLFGEMMPTADKAEGVRAFAEKRPPRFQDR